MFFSCVFAWKRASLEHSLITLSDGNEAIQILKNTGADQICLVLLDIKMPRLDGFQLLKWVKARPELQELRVVMFSASSLDCDRTAARDLGADSYGVKPSTFAGLVGLIDALHQTFLASAASQDLTKNAVQ